MLFISTRATVLDRYLSAYNNDVVIVELLFLPSRASEQGNVIGFVSVYIYIYIYIYIYVIKKKL